MGVGTRLARWAAGMLRGPEGRRGASTAEYALLLALVVIVLISALSTLGGVLNEKLQAIIEQLNQAGGG